MLLKLLIIVATLPNSSIAQPISNAVASDPTPNAPTADGRSHIKDYTLAPVDCGQQVQLGTGATGQFTLTIPNSSEFVTPCVVRIINSDASRGKIIAGLNGVKKLYPTQSFDLAVLNGAWSVTRYPNKFEITGSTTFYVDAAAGSDSNDCLAPGTGACANSAQAMADIARNAVLHGVAVIQWGCTLAPCTYVNAPFSAQSYIGGGSITLQGDTKTPTNIAMSCSTLCGAGLFSFSNITGGIWNIQGFSITSSAPGVHGIIATGAGPLVTFSAINFGTLAGKASHISCPIQCRINSGGNYVISGGAISHIDCQDGSVCHLTEGVATIVGSPAFTAFLSAHGAGAIVGTDSTHFSGGKVIGARWKCSLLGLIDTSGTYDNIPGNSRGSPAGGKISADGCMIF